MTAEQQAHEPASHAPDRNLALELARVTEAAAMAAARWVGRGDKNGADGAAVNAMRLLINSVSMRGVVNGMRSGVGLPIASVSRPRMPW